MAFAREGHILSSLLTRRVFDGSSFVSTRSGECHLRCFSCVSRATLNMNGKISSPLIIYGTAWKKERTESLVENAVRLGFRGIDTAGQPKHYNESAVGAGWTAGARSANIQREHLFIQTKFTSLQGQDSSKPLPYDPAAALKVQVAQSIDNSLNNLRTDYVDSFVLHSPLESFASTMEVWKAMEHAVRVGKARCLGISNCYSLQMFDAVYHESTIKPSVLQNRFYAASGFDTDLRAFCRENGVLYQSFWTLSANREAIASPEFIDIAASLQLTPAQLMYSFVRSLDIIPLCGTTDEQHMMQDLAVIASSGTDGGTLANTDLQGRIARIVGVRI